MADIEKMKLDMLEMRKHIDGDIPKDFVSDAMAFALMERCKPLFKYVTRYAKLCGESNQILPVNADVFNEYESYLALINRAVSTRKVFAKGLLTVKNRFKESESYPASQYAYSLGLAISLAKLGYDLPLRENAKEYERLKTDEAYFNAEVERYLKII